VEVVVTLYPITRSERTVRCDSVRGWSGYHKEANNTITVDDIQFCAIDEQHFPAAPYSNWRVSKGIYPVNTETPKHIVIKVVKDYQTLPDLFTIYATTVLGHRIYLCEFYEERHIEYSVWNSRTDRDYTLHAVVPKKLINKFIQLYRQKVYNFKVGEKTEMSVGDRRIIIKRSALSDRLVIYLPEDIIAFISDEPENIYRLIRETLRISHDVDQFTQILQSIYNFINHF